MATFEETFLCTGLAESVTGTKLRVAVLISPRLTSDGTGPATLDNWPDARDWPLIKPTWQVTITQGATTATLPATEVSAEPFDIESWKRLFPPTMPITPYLPTDRSAAPVRSYPVAAVRNGIRALHARTMVGSRTGFPAVEALRVDPTFAAAMKAADPAVVREAQQGQAVSPPNDASLRLETALAMAELFHGDRPGSAPVRQPTVTKVDPDHVFHAVPPVKTSVTLTGTNLDGATKVTFGGEDATDILVTDAGTKLTCMSPPGPAAEHVSETRVVTVVDVIVTTPRGTSPASPSAKFRRIDDHTKPR